MKVDVVVDVGNTRIKWGRCTDEGVVEGASLLPDDPAGWLRQINLWQLPKPAHWVVSGVHPARRDGLIAWLKERGDQVLLIDDYRQLPLSVLVQHPEKVGIDRLLNAVAAKIGALRFDSIIIDAGSAVTVDYLDETGAFRGGAIFPGFRLMGEALHTHTALLPQTDHREPNPQLPGANTEAAIKAGVYWAVAGGVKAVIRQLMARARSNRRPEIYITGGDAGLLFPVMEPEVQYIPQLTLEGIRLTALSLPEPPAPQVPG
jgi:type III pantothenate kinase